MIPAGGSGKLTAKLKINAGTSGSHAKSITVQTDAPQSPVLRLSLAYTAVNPITAVPNFRLYLNTVEGEPASVRVRLHRDDGEALEARVVEMKPAGSIEVKVEKVVDNGSSGEEGKGATGDLWIVAEILDTSSAINQNGVVVLATNHPQMPKLELPSYIRVRPMIELRPQAITLWPPEGGPNGTQSNIRISHSLRKPFEVTEVQVADPDLISAQVTSQAGQPIQAVLVSLVEGVAAADGPIQTVVRIATSVEGKEPLVVPVTITDRHKALRDRQRSLSSQAVPKKPATP